MYKRHMNSTSLVSSLRTTAFSSFVVKLLFVLPWFSFRSDRLVFLSGPIESVGLLSSGCESQCPSPPRSRSKACSSSSEPDRPKTSSPRRELKPEFGLALGPGASFMMIDEPVPMLLGCFFPVQMHVGLLRKDHRT